MRAGGTTEAVGRDAVGGRGASQGGRGAASPAARGRRRAPDHVGGREAIRSGSCPRPPRRSCPGSPTQGGCDPAHDPPTRTATGLLRITWVGARRSGTHRARARHRDRVPDHPPRTMAIRHTIRPPAPPWSCSGSRGWEGGDPGRIAPAPATATAFRITHPGRWRSGTRPAHPHRPPRPAARRPPPAASRRPPPAARGRGLPGAAGNSRRVPAAARRLAPYAPRRGRKDRSRSEFVTTNTLESAIAAPAKSGLSRPATATGIRTTL